jgi:hypothetical protein
MRIGACSRRGELVPWQTVVLDEDRDHVGFGRQRGHAEASRRVLVKRLAAGHRLHGGGA